MICQNRASTNQTARKYARANKSKAVLDESESESESSESGDIALPKHSERAQMLDIKVALRASVQFIRDNEGQFYLLGLDERSAYCDYGCVQSASCGSHLFVNFCTKRLQRRKQILIL
jgi:hypothetical protein